MELGLKKVKPNITFDQLNSKNSLGFALKRTFDKTSKQYEEQKDKVSSKGNKTINYMVSQNKDPLTINTVSTK